MSVLNLPSSNVGMSVKESGDHIDFTVRGIPAENEKEKMEGSKEDGVRQRLLPWTASAVASDSGKVDMRDSNWLKGAMAELENIESMCTTFIDKLSAPRLSSSGTSQSGMIQKETEQITVGKEVLNSLQIRPLLELKGKYISRSSQENQERNSMDVIGQSLEQLEHRETEVRRVTEEECSDNGNLKHLTMLQQSSPLSTLEGTDDHKRTSLQSRSSQKNVSIFDLSDSMSAEDDKYVQHKAIEETCARTEDVILVTPDEEKKIERCWQAIARILSGNVLAAAPVPAKSSFMRTDNQKRSSASSQKVAKEDLTATPCTEDMKRRTQSNQDNLKSISTNALASLITGRDNVQTTVVDTPPPPVATTGMEKKLEPTQSNDHVLRRYSADFSMGQNEKLRGCQHECRGLKDEFGQKCVDCGLKGTDLQDETTLLSSKKLVRPSAEAIVVDQLPTSTLERSKGSDVGVREVLKTKKDSLKNRRCERNERKVRKKGKKRKAQVTEFTISKRKRGLRDVIMIEEDSSEKPRNAEYEQEVPQCSGIEEDTPYEHYRWEPDEGTLDGQGESSLASVWEMRALARAEAPSPESEPSQVCEHMNIDWDEDLGWYCEDCGLMGNREKLRGCQHLCRGWKDEVGQYCEDCGLTGTDIQKIFIPSQNIPTSRKQTDLSSRTKESEKAGGTEPQFNLQVPPRNDQEFCEASLELEPVFDNVLHTHQKEGFHFLARNLVGDKQGGSLGCIIAHAPGTGKTCLMISFIQSFLSRFLEGRVLILAPKIMLNSWQNEFTRWKVENTPIFCLNDCTQKESSAGAEYELQETLELYAEIPTHVKNTLKENRARVLQDWRGGRGVLLMSYTLFAIMVDRGLDVKAAPDALDSRMCRVVLDAPDLVILDEGHLARTKQTKILKSLRQMRTRRRVLVSGTLFHNNFKELYTLLKLCRDDFMRAHPHYSEKLAKRGGQSKQSVLQQEENMFQEEIGEILENHVKNGMVADEEMRQAVKKLRMLTASFVHWYPGTILENLPGLVEYSLTLNLTDVQKKVILSLPPTKGKSRFAVENKIFSACIHPSLVKRHRTHNPYFDLNNSRPTEPSPSTESDDPSQGVKIQFLLRLLKLCEKSHEKMLIFCSTLGPLNYIQAMLLKKWNWKIGQQVLRLDGTMTEVDRQEVIRLFNQCPGSGPGPNLLLASTKACKEGISLVGASRVLIIDNVDNPSVLRQAVSRAFRIGQTKKVFVYRLLTNQKEEVELFHRSVNKEKLSKVLLHTFNRTMTQKDDFLQPINSPSEVEDELLQKLMLEDDKREMINVVHRYNASGSLKHHAADGGY